MAAASKMRKSDSNIPAGDDPVEVVVDKPDRPTSASEDPKPETKKQRSGMKLPPPKAKIEEPDEINWDEIEADLKPVNEPESEEKGGWGEGVNRTNWAYINRLQNHSHIANSSIAIESS